MIQQPSRTNLFYGKIINCYCTFDIRVEYEFDIVNISFSNATTITFDPDICRRFYETNGFFTNIYQTFKCFCGFVCLRRWIRKLKKYIFFSSKLQYGKKKYLREWVYCQENSDLHFLQINTLRVGVYRIAPLPL